MTSVIYGHSRYKAFWWAVVAVVFLLYSQEGNAAIAVKNPLQQAYMDKKNITLGFCKVNTALPLRKSGEEGFVLYDDGWRLAR